MRRYSIDFNETTAIAALEAILSMLGVGEGIITYKYKYGIKICQAQAFGLSSIYFIHSFDFVPDYAQEIMVGLGLILTI